MKPLRFLFYSLCLLSAAAKAQLNPNLVALYKFDNNLADSSGHNYHLTPTGNYNFSSGRTNTANECFYFDTTLAHHEADASVDGITQMNNTEFTLAFWIKPSLNMLDKAIKNLNRGYTACSGLYSWGLEQYPYSSGGGNKTRATSDSVGLDCYVYHTNFTDYRYVTMILDTQWNHVAFTFKANDSIRAYRNGILIDSLTTAFPYANLADIPDKLFFGHSNPNYHSAVTKLDDYHLYNKQMNAMELLQLYQNSLPNAVSNIDNPVALTVYPNPCNDYFNFQVEEREGTLQVYSLRGQLLREERLKQGLNVQSIKDFTQGTYILKVKTKSKTYHSILVKR